MELSVITFNCKGFKMRNYEFLKYIYNECNILFLQEHWLFSFQFTDFSKLFPDSSYFAHSSMSDDDMSCGRGYGGTAIIWKNDLNLKMKKIATTTPRICAAEAKVRDRNFVFMSVYMPTDCN